MNKGIDVEIIKDSTNWTGKRLTTFVLKYPRYIHSELMTHRVFSKNSASSRAIPVLKMIENITNDPVMPIWTKNQSGMQGGELEESIKEWANIAWLSEFESTVTRVQQLVNLNIHKQNANRLIEPWMHIKIILTGTDFENWFELRDHKDAQPEIQALARKMKNVMEGSKPQYLNPGEWHIPFSDDLFESDELIERTFKVLAASEGWKNLDIRPSKQDIYDHMIKTILNISVARCARTSYYNFDGSKNDFNKDLELFHKLITSEPLHASPAEHQAQVPTIQEYINGDYSIKHTISNLVGEYDIPDECMYKVDKYTKLETIRGKYFSNLQGWKQYRKVLEEQKYSKNETNRSSERKEN